MSTTTWTFCDEAITVEDAPDGYRAYLTAQPHFHDVGATVAEAIGHLVIAHEDTVVAVVRATKLLSMTKAEADDLALRVAQTPMHAVVYATERVRGWVVVAQALDGHGGTMTFTLHSVAEWERRHPPVIVQPSLLSATQEDSDHV